MFDNEKANGVRLAAGIISARYQAENIYLYGINEYSLKPKIEKVHPGYFGPKNQYTGGGGAGGEW